MVTNMSEPRFMKFKREMEPAEKIYTKEIERFSKKFDALGTMELKEVPDIDTLDYVYSFEKLNGTKEEELDEILEKLYSHMENFSKNKGIGEFSRNTIILFI